MEGIHNLRQVLIYDKCKGFSKKECEEKSNKCKEDIKIKLKICIH